MICFMKSLDSSSSNELSGGRKLFDDVLLDSLDDFLLSGSFDRLGHVGVGLQFAPGLLSCESFLVDFTFEGVVFKEFVGGFDGGVALVDLFLQLLFPLDESVVLVGQVG
jgi:hypothetical protein